MNENVFKRNELPAQKVIQGLRSRNEAVPINAQRLTLYSRHKDRMHVILVNDSLGF